MSWVKRAPCWNYVFRMMDNEVERNQEVTREEYNRFWERHFKKQDADEGGPLRSIQRMGHAMNHGGLKR